MKSNALLRLPSVLKKTGDSRSALYQKVSNGTFPRPVKIGRRASAWPDSEIDAVIAARIAGRPEAEIRALVDELHTQRSAP